jgi:hypothetical protein
VGYLGIGMTFMLSRTYQCNPGLSRLITMTLDIEKSVWPKDLTKLEGLPLGA